MHAFIYSTTSLGGLLSLKHHARHREKAVSQTNMVPVLIELIVLHKDRLLTHDYLINVLMYAVKVKETTTQNIKNGKEGCPEQGLVSLFFLLPPSASRDPTLDIIRQELKNGVQ